MKQKGINQRAVNVLNIKDISMLSMMIKDTVLLDHRGDWTADRAAETGKKGVIVQILSNDMRDGNTCGKAVKNILIRPEVQREECLDGS